MSYRKKMLIINESSSSTNDHTSDTLFQKFDKMNQFETLRWFLLSPCRPQNVEHITQFDWRQSSTNSMQIERWLRIMKTSKSTACIGSSVQKHLRICPSLRVLMKYTRVRNWSKGKGSARDLERAIHPPPLMFSANQLRRLIYFPTSCIPPTKGHDKYFNILHHFR